MGTSLIKCSEEIVSLIMIRLCVFIGLCAVLASAQHYPYVASSSYQPVHYPRQQYSYYPQPPVYYPRQEYSYQPQPPVYYQPSYPRQGYRYAVYQPQPIIQHPMSQDRVILQNTGHADQLMTNPDHLTSPLKGPLTSPLKGLLTSPLISHLTSPLKGPLTSPLTGLLTSPFTGHPMSHLTNHPMSHLTGHPTSLDPLMSLDHTDHIIDRQDFSFHLPVVSGMLMG